MPANDKDRKKEISDMTAAKMAHDMERRMDEEFKKDSQKHKQLRAGRVVHGNKKD